MLNFIIGLAVGATGGVGVMVWHTKGIEKAVAKLRGAKDAEIRHLRELNAQLRADSDIIQQTRDCADAFRRGKEVGRFGPATRAEQFAKTFEGKNVQFREHRVKSA